MTQRLSSRPSNSNITKIPTKILSRKPSSRPSLKMTRSPSSRPSNSKSKKPTSKPTTSPNKKKTLSGGAIFGIILVVFVSVALFGWGIWKYLIVKSKRSYQMDSQQAIHVEPDARDPLYLRQEMI